MLCIGYWPGMLCVLSIFASVANSVACNHSISPRRYGRCTRFHSRDGRVRPRHAIAGSVRGVALGHATAPEMVGQWASVSYAFLIVCLDSLQVLLVGFMGPFVREHSRSQRSEDVGDDAANVCPSLVLDLG